MANIELMEISHRVSKLSKECPVSGNDSNRLMEFHGLVAPRGTGFWESYKDKKVLDVCSGLSDFTAKLLQLGADAYALDLGYSDVRELFIRSGNRPAGMFSRSLNQDRSRYIYGSSHNLPFESNTFDAVTSFYGIFGVLDDDVYLARQSVNEAIRVLKPGGVLSVGPVMDGDISIIQAATEDVILGELEKRDDIAVNVRNPEPKRMSIFNSATRIGKLTIIKNA